ncbi:putative pre-rRNA-processing protein [Besnoitia besnoiti]|uniref:Putative pre-rRNA-processing protein n=1 Tax=Besnoitia besnoiti TaxID=94643 RepID=A0A2A9MEL2_BESBE|nr:putative pre-rRNA-processing protein [Besnoitia besnoiti]PFH33822.1 putative pre-rRNA-processing protein [Besnoitia besnoiti]
MGTDPSAPNVASAEAHVPAVKLAAKGNIVHKKHRVDGRGESGADSACCPSPFRSCAPALSLKEQKKQEPGILYISRIPPWMTRAALRQYFERFGKLGRLHIKDYASPEQHCKRPSASSSRPSSVSSAVPTEGWLEFLDKRVARRVAQLLNGQAIGGKKRKSRWREDLWCLNYLKGFTWQQLIEEKVYKHRVREARLNAALNEVKRQNTLYLELVDEQRRLQKMEAKRAAKGRGKRGEDDEESPSESGSDSADAEETLEKEEEAVKAKKRRLGDHPKSRKASSQVPTKKGETPTAAKTATRAISDDVLDQFVL